MFGKTAFGVIRTTYVIDAEGVIRKVWRRVKVSGHDAQVLEVVKKLAK
jgi:peroxiredoxin Q/BCP